MQRIKNKLYNKNTVEADISQIQIGEFTPQIKAYLEQFRLQVLVMNSCGLTSLKKFPYLPAIQALDLSDNKLDDNSDIGVLAQFIYLTQIFFSQNNIKRLQTILYLEKLTRLIQIDCSDNPVSDDENYRETLFLKFKQLEIVNNLDKEGNQIDDEEEYEDEEDYEDEDEDFEDDEQSDIDQGTFLKVLKNNQKLDQKVIPNHTLEKEDTKQQANANLSDSDNIKQQQEIKTIKKMIEQMQSQITALKKNSEETNRDHEIMNKAIEEIKIAVQPIHNQEKNTVKQSKENQKESVLRIQEKQKIDFKELQEQIRTIPSLIQNELEAIDTSVIKKIEKMMRINQTAIETSIDSLKVLLHNLTCEVYCALILTDEFDELSTRKKQKVKRRLISVIQNNSQELDLSNCELKGTELRYEFIPNRNNIIKIKMDNNKIGDSGAQALSKIKWRNLQHLELGYNNIGDIGARQLSRSNWLKLERLNLMWNKIGQIGAKQLMTKNWPCLQQLQLRLNNVPQDLLSNCVNKLQKKTSVHKN